GSPRAAYLIPAVYAAARIDPDRNVRSEALEVLGELAREQEPAREALRALSADEKADEPARARALALLDSAERALPATENAPGTDPESFAALLARAREAYGALAQGAGLMDGLRAAALAERTRALEAALEAGDAETAAVAAQRLERQMTPPAGFALALGALPERAPERFRAPLALQVRVRALWAASALAAAAAAGIGAAAIVAASAAASPIAAAALGTAAGAYALARLLAPHGRRSADVGYGPRAASADVPEWTVPAILTGLMERLGLPAERAPESGVYAPGSAAALGGYNAASFGPGLRPDSTVAVGEGWLRESESALRGLLAHEVGHLFHRDGFWAETWRRLGRLALGSFAALTLATVLGWTSWPLLLASGLALAASWALQLGYRRGIELRADLFGAWAAGSRAMRDFLRVARARVGDGASLDHPGLDAREANLPPR
ncbi:MAG TPA: M48 family metalloprotease, partial [Elusimicrobiota bacterium]|nr:M48 family metalloprotease [Elusimicrobiota bacterium]